MATTQIQSKGSPDTLKALLTKQSTLDKLQSIAPKYLSPERLVKILLLTVSRDWKLTRCTPQSLLAALMRCAQFGLEPDGRLAHLIPYKDQVNVIVDWKGLVEIGRRNGIEVRASLVYENDEFSFLEDDGNGRCFLRHGVAPGANRGKLLGAYSRSKRIDGTGSVDYEWMSLEEIHAIRKRSPAGNEGPWVTDFNEMARKTVIRRHSKRWPLCAEDRTATEDDDGHSEMRHAGGNVQVDEPKKPLFAQRTITDGDEDDLAYEQAPEPTVDVAPEPAPKAEPKQDRKAKAKAPEPKAEPARPAPGVEGGTAHERLQAFVEGDQSTTFEVFKATVVELGHIPEAAEWTAYKDVDEAHAEKLLAARRGLTMAIDVKKKELGL